jgi:hypothetical protein
MVRVAARIGYRAVGLRLIAVTDDSPGYPIMDDAIMMRETRAALADTGLRLSDVEFIKITPEINVATPEPFIAAGASLGARHVITGPYDHDRARLSDNLAAIASLSGRYGLSALLEFSRGPRCRTSKPRLRLWVPPHARMPAFSLIRCILIARTAR